MPTFVASPATSCSVRLFADLECREAVPGRAIDRGQLQRWARVRQPVCEYLLKQIRRRETARRQRLSGAAVVSRSHRWVENPRPAVSEMITPAPGCLPAPGLPNSTIGLAASCLTTLVSSSGTQTQVGLGSGRCDHRNSICDLETVVFPVLRPHHRRHATSAISKPFQWLTTSIRCSRTECSDSPSTPRSPASPGDSTGTAQTLAREMVAPTAGQAVGPGRGP